MLPHEAEVQAEIATKYGVQLAAMTALHDAVLGMMTAGSWTIGKRGLNKFVATTMMGLLTKALKTFRSIQLLCERGLHEDANALVRVLMETMVAVLFILQRKPRERAVIYHAHSIAQDCKMLREWKKTKGLKRQAPKTRLEQAEDAVARYVKWLPAGTNVKGHWSGKGSLKEATEALSGGAALYASLYRFTSSTSHASDPGAHFSVEKESGDFVWEIEPTVSHFETPTYAAREMLWHLANRIDERFGLGHSATLAAHKLTREEVKQGQR